ncbi:MAG: glycopeptide antibiotics resistance protein [Gammaproteobacteria bacterium]
MSGIGAHAGSGAISSLGPREPNSGLRVWLCCAAVLCSCFVLYGSLVPHDYSWVRLGVAWERFVQGMSTSKRGYFDWYTNIVLFIPLAALWYGGCTETPKARSSRGVQGVWAVLIYVFLLAFGTGIEFLQVFTPVRTSSAHDVAAQSIGIGIGLALWLLTRRWVAWSYHAWHTSANHRLKLQLILMLYVVALVFYNVMPGDLMHGMDQLADKWADGRIALNPFYLSKTVWSEQVYELGADALVWAPVAVLLAWDGLRRVRTVLLLVLGGAVALECIQLFVFSRFTDVRDILSAGVGGVLGLFAVRMVRRVVPQPSSSPDGRVLDIERQAGGALWAVTLAWMAVLCATFWFPFNFGLGDVPLGERLDSLLRLPLHAYYVGSETTALTQFARKIGFFTPLGLALGLLGIGRLGALMLAGSLALFVEIGQVFLPGKILDIADILLACAGAYVGWLLAGQLRSPAPSEKAGWQAAQWQSADQLRGFVYSDIPSDARPGIPSGTRPDVPPEVPSDNLPLHAPTSAPLSWWWVVYPVMVLGAAVGAHLFVQLNVLPYNVRELFSESVPWVSGAGLAIAVVGIVLGPLALAQVLASRRGASPVWFALGAIILGALIWLALWVSVPKESMHDIVGSPILLWPWHFELAGRFIFVQMPIAVLGAGAGLLVLARHTRVPMVLAVGRWIIAGLPLLVIAHWVVVPLAATDNLTELMAGGGTYKSSVLLSIWVALCWLCGYGLASALAQSSLRMLALYTVLVVVSFPIGNVVLSEGLGDVIEKYGRTFSALQFLLSPARDQLLSEAGVSARYYQFHGLLVLSIAALSLPAWLAWRTRTRMRQLGIHEETTVRATIGGGDYRVVALPPEYLEALDAMPMRLRDALAGILDGYMRDVPRASFSDSVGARLGGIKLQPIDVWFDEHRLHEVDEFCAMHRIDVSTLAQYAMAFHLESRGHTA